MELLDYEKAHIEYCLNNAHEGTLFLKRNEDFPLSSPCKVVLVGSGARQTIKGGTGSGDVASRFFSTFEQGLENAGFEITSKEWLDKYDAFRAGSEKDYIRDAKKEARKAHIIGGVYSMGWFEEEKNYDFEPNYEGDIAIYVIARNSGEGNDRRTIKGDIYLSDREVKDINYLNSKFEKFMLVLNVGGVVDLSKVQDVENILYISQLGVVTGDILPRILLGTVNPSGKLTTTWADIEEYPFFNEFGDLHDTCYKEGVYVGYRYFDSAKKEVRYPFGFGLSYTSFEIENVGNSFEYPYVKITAKVKNTGKFAGKEVVQAYLSAPQTNLAKPYQSLAGFKKTSLLQPGEEEVITIEFDIRDSSSYDESSEMYFLDKGNFIVRLGNSSRNTKPICKISNPSILPVKKVKNVFGKPEFADYAPSVGEDDLDVETFAISSIDVIDCVQYKKDIYIEEKLKSLTDNELMLMTLGNHGKGWAAVVGLSAVHVIGGAGETTLAIPSVDKSITMADGPAGLRLKPAYGIDKKGIYDVEADPMSIKMAKFFPKFVGKWMLPPKNRHGEVHRQITTAIPIGTSIAMSFNEQYAYELGELVAQEMDIFGVHLWLAPALNIHRNIRCGRNFEYFSEDPLVSGLFAAAITKGVQSHPNRGVTIKHFAGNNQELNRTNNNDHVSERAMREIYLRGFEFCIRESKPLSIMTSYNLINGIHTSEHYGLINDILRCEWGFEGLVMTDWVQSGRSFCSRCKYPATFAHKNVLSGNDLTMPGAPKDEKDIMKALKKGILTREDLLVAASRIYRSIELINK